MDFRHLQEIYLTNMEKLLNTATKRGLDALKTASNKPLGTNGPLDKNSSDKTQDISMPYVGNGYV